MSPAGVLSPAQIVIDGDTSDLRVQEAIAKLEKSLVDSTTFPVPPVREVNEAGDRSLLTLPFPGESSSREATAKLNLLRNVHIPAAFDGVPAVALVGGVTAEAADFYGIVDVYTPVVFVFVLGLSFIILTMVFRSIVIPIKAIIMNLLSVGATYGLLALVFQKGVGADLLGFQRAEVSDRGLYNQYSEVVLTSPGGCATRAPGGLGRTTATCWRYSYPADCTGMATAGSFPVRIRIVHARIRRLLNSSEDWIAEDWGAPISAAHFG